MATRMRFVALLTLVDKAMPRPISPEAVAEVQDAIGRRGAWLEYGSPGQPSLVAALDQGSFRRVDIGRPSLILYTRDPDQAVPLAHVRSLQVNNHWMGAAEGLGIGFLSGVLIGALAAPSGKSSCDPGDDHCLGMDFGDEILLLSMLACSVAGTVIGAAVGQRYVYTF
jgi:hypothetical protein